MWEFEHLTSRPGNPKSNAKSESAIRNSKNLLDKVLDNRGAIDSTKISGNFGPKTQWISPFDASTWQFWTIEMHRGIMARCCHPFVHSTAACDTAVNRGIRFHVETLHIIPLRPSPIFSTSVIFLLGRCFLLGAVLLSERAFFHPDFQGILDCWSQLPDLESLSATAVSHFSCALLPCRPLPDKWSLLSLPETRSYGSSVVLLRPTMPDVQLLLSWVL